MNLCYSRDRLLHKKAAAFSFRSGAAMLTVSGALEDCRITCRTKMLASSENARGGGEPKVIKPSRRIRREFDRSPRKED